MIDRPQYLRALRRWKDKQMIKVITGIRRCGKSTLMELFQAELRLDGVPDSQIIDISSFYESEPAYYEDQDTFVNAVVLLRAMEEGYLVDAGQETLEGLDCLRLALDTTAPGGKVLCTVWLGGDGAPLYAEFSQDSRVVLTARLLSFTSE